MHGISGTCFDVATCVHSSIIIEITRQNMYERNLVLPLASLDVKVMQKGLQDIYEHKEQLKMVCNGCICPIF